MERRRSLRQQVKKKKTTADNQRAAEKRRCRSKRYLLLIVLQHPSVPEDSPVSLPPSPLEYSVYISLYCLRAVFGPGGKEICCWTQY